MFSRQERALHYLVVANYKEWASNVCKDFRCLGIILLQLCTHRVFDNEECLRLMRWQSSAGTVSINDNNSIAGSSINSNSLDSLGGGSSHHSNSGHHRIHSRASSPTEIVPTSSGNSIVSNSSRISNSGNNSLISGSQMSSNSSQVTDNTSHASSGSSSSNSSSRASSREGGSRNTNATAASKKGGMVDEIKLPVLPNTSGHKKEATSPTRSSTRNNIDSARITSAANGNNSNNNNNSSSAAVLAGTATETSRPGTTASTATRNSSIDKEEADALAAAKEHQRILLCNTVEKELQVIYPAIVRLPIILKHLLIEVCFSPLPSSTETSLQFRGLLSTKLECGPLIDAMAINKELKVMVQKFYLDAHYVPPVYW